MLALAAGHDGAACKLLEHGADISSKNKVSKHHAPNLACGERVDSSYAHMSGSVSLA